MNIVEFKDRVKTICLYQKCDATELLESSNPSYYQITQFCNKASIDLELLLDLSADINKELAFLKGDFFPERYRDGHKGSKVRTIKNVIEYLSVYSSNDAKKILRKLNVGYKNLCDPEEEISVLLLDDIYREMMKLGYTSTFFRLLAKRGAQEYKKSFQFFKGFRNITSTKKLIEVFFNENIKYLDMNWIYTIKRMSNNSLVFKVDTAPEVQNLAKVKNFGCIGMSSHRVGFLEGLSEYYGDSSVTVHQRKSICEGADYCEYEVLYH